MAHGPRGHTITIYNVFVFYTQLPFAKYASCDGGLSQFIRTTPFKSLYAMSRCEKNCCAMIKFQHALIIQIMFPQIFTNENNIKESRHMYK